MLAVLNSIAGLLGLAGVLISIGMHVATVRQIRACVEEHSAELHDHERRISRIEGYRTGPIAIIPGNGE